MVEKDARAGYSESDSPPDGSSLPEVAVRSAPDEKPFFVAGIGSSAGGLEASQQFFRNLPADTGIAFVLIPHLSPEHKGLLPELLQHETVMKVVQAEDGMQVRPNNVYVIPPNKNLSIFHGTFQLLDLDSSHAMRMPINHFFQSLAQDQGDKAIAIILSGMGTDGSLGVKAIKENFGLTLSQNLQTAKFDGMPRSAIGTEMVDYVLPVVDMPARLLDYVRRSGQAPMQEDALQKKSASALLKICALLRSHTGNDFSLYKTNSVLRRVQRRMSIHQLDNIADYVHYIQDNPHELDLFFKELLIGVTSFFRDPELFKALESRFLPDLLTRKSPGDPFRVWIPGCSTGEEAYSVAILLHECIRSLKLTGVIKPQIFATDIDEAAIDKARQGSFPANIADDVSHERLKLYFREDASGYRITKEVRESVVFAPQNLLLDPPFTRLDMLSCRNVLIYLNTETQQKLVPLFHYALDPGGILILGTSETIGDQTDLFDEVDTPCKLYRRTEGPAVSTKRFAIPSSAMAYDAPRAQRDMPTFRSSEGAVLEETQRILLDDFTPSAVLINDKGDILYISGRTGKYLELPAGKANMNLFVMAREGLRLEIGTALHQAVSQQSDVVVRDIKVKTNGDYLDIDLTIRPLKAPDGLRGLFMVVFKDVDPRVVPLSERRTKRTRTKPDDAHIAALETELKASKEHLQSVIEQIDTSKEEIQSANEELQSANEELQSTNEELMTSREEMQSLNEELQTVNAELTTKCEELSRAYDDMKNLLNGTDVATVFLDRKLNIKRFTPAITQIIKLIPSDIGRPVSDISLNLMYDDLEIDLRNVMDTLILKEVQVQAKNKHWYVLRMMPYLTAANVIDGVVITFMDFTQIKQLETALIERETVLQASKDYVASIIATLREPFVVLDAEMRIISANTSFYSLFQTSSGETEGRSLYSLNDGKWRIPDLKRLLEELLPQHAEIHDLKIEHDFPVIGHRVLVFNARQIYRDKATKQEPMILLAMEDITNKVEPAESG